MGYGQVYIVILPLKPLLFEVSYISHMAQEG